MQFAALNHTCRSPLAYPVDGDKLRVVLQAARGDLARATCLHADRYAWPPEKDEPVAMALLGDDGVHEYWGVTLPAASRRIRYLFYVEGQDGERAWLGE
ncbi:MAG: alpha amylase N-terminal ig-like domain-containing protein, partial [Mycobacterium leprae]